MATEPLTLYHLEYCPFCVMVRREADQLGIPLRLVDIRRVPGAADKLIAFRGRSTVPVLGIPSPEGERLLPESRDIVSYLRANQDALRAA